MANRFIRQGGSGSITGTGTLGTWANAMPTWPATMVRGDTYYVATGTYAGKTFNTAADGQTITIKGATVADHGIETGWSPSMSVNAADGGSQAIFTSTCQFNTSNWVFDSTVYPANPSSSNSRTTTAYGFRVSTQNYPFVVYNRTATTTGVRITGVSGTATSADVEKFFLSTDNETQSIHFVTLSHCLCNGYSNTTWATSPGLQHQDWTTEYNVVLNGFSSFANHGEDLNNNYGDMVRWTIRWNWFEGRSSGTACIVALNDDVTSYLIYGNVFKSLTTSDGTCCGVINQSTQELRGVIYNNTYIQCGIGGWIGTATLSTIRNNLLYNMSAGIGSGTSSSSIQSTAYFSTTNTPSAATESTRYVATGNPFTNLAGNDLTLNQSLGIVSAMPAGAVVGAPYNVDMFGNTGTQRGAFQISGSPPDTTPPAAPTGVTVS